VPAEGTGPLGKGYSRVNRNRARFRRDAARKEKASQRDWRREAWKLSLFR